MDCDERFTSVENLTPYVGDLIEIKRTCFNHWGIYAGEGYIIYATKEMNGTAWIHKMKLSHVANGDLVRVNNKEESAIRMGKYPRNGNEAVRKAHRILGMQVEYNQTELNSEYYATEWKYGFGWVTHIDPMYYWVGKGIDFVKTDAVKVAIGVGARFVASKIGLRLGLGIAAAGLLFGSMFPSEGNSADNTAEHKRRSFKDN